MEIIKNPMILCVSGLKNAGKTTCIESLIPKLTQEGLKVAVIKHDGHDFEADVKGTDTYRHKQAGAYGTAIFSKNKYMIVKEQNDISETELIKHFPEADMILIEGLKYATYPKIEVIRKDNCEKKVCDEQTVIAYVSDISLSTNKKVFMLDQYDELAQYIMRVYSKERNIYGNS